MVFDMDGTLYRQRPVQSVMAYRLLIHALTDRNGWHDLLVLKHYRKNRERLARIGASRVSHLQFQATSKAYRLTEDQLAQLVRKWMVLKPLPFLKTARFRDIDQFFESLRRRGIKIGVLSDFPVSEKLEALGLRADIACCAADEDVGRFKPEPAGLLKILKSLGIALNNCLMIGDRKDRDGLCAQAASVPFLLCKGSGFYAKLLVDLNRS